MGISKECERDDFIWIVLHANQTANILTIATRMQNVAARQQTVEQIVATLLPDAPAPVMVGVDEPGTHQMGSWMAPSFYVRGPDEGSFCTWKWLVSLTEDTRSTKATVSHLNLFYVEILAGDISFTTSCELSPLESIPREPNS